MSTSLGIFQGDLIIRSAIVKALADLRENKWVLDYALLNLASDGLTNKDYGVKQIREAREWFLKTDVKVYHSLAITEPEFPCITITLQDSRETEKTLGDVHYDPVEAFSTDDQGLTRPFQLEVVSHDYTTGDITLRIPDEVANNIYIFPNMIIQGDTGETYKITQVPEYNLIVINSTNQKYNLKNAVLKLNPDSAYVVNLESEQMNETYLLGIHVSGPPLYLMVLHTILVMSLLRYKESLLEARGFHESTISSSDFSRNNQMGFEDTFSRYVTISGTVRQYWPKNVNPTVQGTVLKGLRAIGGATTPSPNPTGSLMWIGDEDEIA